MLNEPVVLREHSGVCHSVELGFYPDGTPFVKSDIDLSDTWEMILRPRNISEFIAAMFLVDSITERGGEVYRLVLPCIPGARQDRINPTGDILFTVKSIAKMINDRRFETVHVLDPHSEVSAALIDRCQVTQPWEVYDVRYAFRHDYDGVVIPDLGAVKRATALAQVLNIPTVQGLKHRDVATGKLSGFGLSSDDLAVFTSRGKHLLVADDLCDGGWTFTGLAEEIRAEGMTADLYVSHGIFSKGLDDLAGWYGKIFTTDSYLHGVEHDALHTIEITTEL